MSNNNISDKANPESNRNLEELKAIESLFLEFDFFKSLREEELRSISKQTKLLNFEIGSSLSQNKYIPSNVLFIIKGEGRLLASDEKSTFTVCKLGAGSIVGLSSILIGQACENVISSTQLSALSIPDELILNLYLRNKLVQNWCDQNIFPGEIGYLTDLLIKQSPRTDINFRQAFSILFKTSKIKNIDNNQLININQDEYVLSLSKNIKSHEIGEEIINKTTISWDGNFNARLISIPIQLKKEFSSINSQKEVSKSIKANTELIDKIEQENAPLYPHKTNLDFTESQIENKNYIIRAKGKPNEVLACFEMICKELEVPFRKDSVEKIVRDEIKKQNKISPPIIAGIANLLGLSANLTKVDSKFGTRLPTPSIISWNESYAVLKKSSSNEIIIGSPSEGLIKIKSEDLNIKFSEGIEIIFMNKSSLTPNKKFNLEWFIPSIRKYQGSLILVLIASFIVQLFGLANPLLIQVIIDKVISQRSLDTLQVLGIALVFVTILGGLLGGLRTFLFTETTNRIDTRLGAEVIDHLLRIPLRYFDRRPVGELASRISELEKIRDFLTGQALTTFLDAIFSIIYILVMVIYSWLLTFIALGVVPIQILLTLLGSPLLRRQIREIAKQNATTQSHLVEVLTGIQTVKAQNVEVVSRWKWQELYSKYISRTFEKTITSTALSQVSTVLQQLSQLLVLWVGASLVLKGELSLGQLIAFRIISGYVTQPLLRLSSIWQSIQELKVSFERLADIIDTNEESNESDKSNIPLPSISGEVKFENVDFQFESSTNQVLSNINLTIPKGTFVGIAGQSGSGKSTLMKLLPRLYETKRGRILIDNYDINKIELYSLRRQVGIVPQEPLLFSGTVSENIAITNPDSSSEDIVNAAKAANAHEFIMELPEGYSSFVGERGTGLSGGQKQRIAIARTLLNNPKMIIMDEATSALDYNSERKVCDNLLKSSNNRTVFFITHRLSTIKNADMIIMMNKGTIDELGTHDELMNKKGAYYALYRQQESS